MIKEYQISEYTQRQNVLTGVSALLEVFGGGQSDASNKVGRSIAYMESHVNQPLQISTLAALVNVSPSHFFALFKRQTGSPPMDYFTRLRMQHACRLLDSTSASVKEVAAALGYDDPFYFSRVFKSVSAVAPLYYRGLGFASRQEIKDQLKPKDRLENDDPPRQSESGCFSARGRSGQPCFHDTTKPKNPNSNNENKIQIKNVGRPVDSLDCCIPKPADTSRLTLVAK